MIRIGYSLIDPANNNAEVWHVGEPGHVADIPNPLFLPNGSAHVHCAVPGDTYLSWKFVERWVDDPAPAYCTKTGQTIAYDGAKIIVTITYSPPDLKGYAANARWVKETGGIAVSGVPVPTDDRAKIMIMGARVSADADRTFTTTWVGADGKLYPMTATQIIAMSTAVSHHVNACYATYVDTLSKITSGAITSTDQIDTAFAAQTT